MRRRTLMTISLVANLGLLAFFKYANWLILNWNAASGWLGFDWQFGAVDVLLRPDDIVPDPASELRAMVEERAFKGAQILYTLRLPTGSQVLSLFPSHLEHPRGDTVGIRVQADHLVAFRAE